MADLIQQALAAQAQILKQNASQQVTYQRGGDSVDLSAILGKTTFKVTDGVTGQVKIEHSDQDFIFVVADLFLSGTPIIPKRGDIVLFTQGGIARRFEVYAPQAERPFKYEAYSTMIRVHTKYAGNV